MIAAVDAITLSGRSLFTLAVLSGKPDAVRWVYDFISHYFAGSDEDGYGGSTLERSILHQEVHEAGYSSTDVWGDRFVGLSYLLMLNASCAQTFQCHTIVVDTICALGSETTDPPPRRWKSE